MKQSPLRTCVTSIPTDRHLPHTAWNVKYATPGHPLARRGLQEDVVQFTLNHSQISVILLRFSHAFIYPGVTPSRVSPEIQVPTVNVLLISRVTGTITFQRSMLKVSLWQCLSLCSHLRLVEALKIAIGDM